MKTGLHKLSAKCTHDHLENGILWPNPGEQESPKLGRVINIFVGIKINLERCVSQALYTQVTHLGLYLQLGR